MREFRYVNLVGATGQWRNETFDDHEFLVVPVVALVEGVVHAANAPAPELVLASVFSKAPGGWDGEPVTWDHPKVDGEFVSANSPEILKAYAFGRVFNSYADGDRLRMEAWLDLAMAAELLQAQAVVDRILAGEVIEISVGAFIIADAEEGMFNGKRFAARWLEVTPDHLALLPAGVEGACSVEMGCGAGRVMRVTASGLVGEPSVHMRVAAEGLSDNELREMLEVALHAAEPGSQYVWVEAIFDDLVVYSVSSHEGPTLLYERGWSMQGADVAVDAEREQVRRHVSYPTVAAAQPVVEPTANQETDDVTIFDRTLAAFAKLRGGLRDAAQGGLSDAELRDALDAALHQAAPGYQQIVEVFPDTGTVVYAAAPGGEQLQFMSRTFKAAKDGTVTVNDAALEVKPVTRFEPLEDGSPEGNPCGCTLPPTGAATPKPESEDHTMDLAKRIAALVECPNTAFTAEHVPFLKTLDEAGIVTFEEMARPLAPPVTPDEGKPDGEVKPDGEGTPDPDADKPPVDTVQLSRAEYTEMRAASTAFGAQQAERKQLLVASIRLATDAYTEEELGTKDVDELEKLGQAVDAATPEIDYGMRPVPRAASSHEPPPRIYDLALAKREAQG